jgi:hypothetical protein
VEQQDTEKNVNVSGGKNTDKKEESKRTENRGNKPSDNVKGDRDK